MNISFCRVALFLVVGGGICFSSEPISEEAILRIAVVFPEERFAPIGEWVSALQKTAGVFNVAFRNISPSSGKLFKKCFFPEGESKLLNEDLQVSSFRPEIVIESNSGRLIVFSLSCGSVLVREKNINQWQSYAIHPALSDRMKIWSYDHIVFPLP